MIIDVDAHAEPTPSWLDDSPLAARMPKQDQGEVTMKFVAGDLLEDVPRDQWPALEQLLPPGMAAIAGKERVEGFAYDDANQRGVADPPKRVAWLDSVGIDAQNVICLEGLTVTRFMHDRPLAREVISACNTWMADAHDGYTDRLWPVTALDFTDLDWAIAELTRMRARGSRVPDQLGADRRHPAHALALRSPVVGGHRPRNDPDPARGIQSCSFRSRVGECRG